MTCLRVHVAAGLIKQERHVIKADIDDVQLLQLSCSRQVKDSHTFRQVRPIMVDPAIGH